MAPLHMVRAVVNMKSIRYALRFAGVLVIGCASGHDTMRIEAQQETDRGVDRRGDEREIRVINLLQNAALVCDVRLKHDGPWTKNLILLSPPCFGHGDATVVVANAPGTWQLKVTTDAGISQITNINVVGAVTSVTIRNK